MIITTHNSSVKDYLALMKPRVMLLVVFTSFSGMWLAPLSIHPFIACIAMLCITLGAGSSAAVNMWYDRDIDAIMKRTQNRPLVTKSIKPEDALAFGIIMAFFSVLLMGLCVNLLSRVAGALPPVIGWATVTADISLASLSLFLIILTWTPPHSWALALFRLEDYKNCNVPMMPVIKGESYTKKQMVIYSIIMFITSFFPYFFKIANILYLMIALILGIIFLYYVVSLFKDQNNKQAKKLFAYSIFYLFSIFLALDFGGVV
ncbi:Protoheme IX farnesyltransferase [Pseudolycoriella hygida]|uniref:Protoheme IX farnesyltransferase n=1 Tax=Pseudolycoriella hygida TaxID=35572 RepID=A0A9Q0N6Z4_9DIPT|nr:Protoheme IX farnesyltransferase [Pseudolycoriella hygida]